MGLVRDDRHRHTVGAVAVLVSQPSQVQLLVPVHNEQIIVAETRGEPFREHHGRDCLVAAEHALGQTRNDAGPTFDGEGRKASDKLLA